ncbi:MAG: flagellar export protein FliJ [Pseudomonadota bacterium]
MKSRDGVIRLKRFEVDEKRRKVADIESMIAEFNDMAVDLDRQIAVEQERAGVTDVNHYAYPTFAKAAMQRRDNLAVSVAGLEAKLAAAKGELAEAEEELRKIEVLQGRDTQRMPEPEPEPDYGMIGVARAG